ncbi:Tat protein [Simian immunodeficiency virus]|uniref:Protein Tat n=1 Tax=Simian immunodeficiency virus TaxID=11723 RepID=Q9Q083_SIV|nr:Tat protein [Simian immunodeficiency virus]
MQQPEQEQHTQQKQHLDQLEEIYKEAITDPLQSCQNKCHCKVCCFHCILCFQQKALGIRYYVHRTRRRVTYILETEQDPRAKNSQTKKERQRKTEKTSTST